MLRCGSKTQQLFADELIEGRLRSVTVSDRASGFALPYPDFVRDGAKSVDSLPRESISPTPEFADGTPFSFVVNSFLVWAADDAIRHDNRQDAMALYEVQDLLRWLDLPARRRAPLSSPASRVARRSRTARCRLRLGRLAQVRAVERDGCDRPAAHSLPGLLPQAFEKSISRWHGAWPRADACRIGYVTSLPRAKG
jgi:hypothetical protein